MRSIVAVCAAVLAFSLVLSGGQCRADEMLDATAKLKGMISPKLAAGQIDEIRSLLDQGADIETTGPEGRTLLWAASINGHLEIVRLLLEKGAQVDKTANDGSTALSPACLEGHLEVARLLIQKGADVNKATDNGMTPLFFAAAGGNPEVVKLLLAKGAHPAKMSSNGSTPLSVACKMGRIKVVRLLLAAGKPAVPGSSPTKEYAGSCFLDMNRRNTGVELTPVFQDPATCKKYVLKERIMGQLFLTDAAIPCRVIGSPKGNAILYDAMVVNLEKTDRDAIVKQRASNCGKKETKGTVNK